MKIFFLATALVVLSLTAHAIHHGESVDVNDFTYVVGIKDCTGVFLNSRVMVTAAHCVEDGSIREPFMEIYPYSRDGFYRYDIAAPVVPKDRIRKYTYKDIAVIVLDKTFPGLENFKISFKKNVSNSAELFVVGMGVKSTPRKGSSFVTTSVRKTKAEYTAFNINKDVLQTRNKVDSRLACGGDSGGAVFINEDGENKLVGVMASVDPAGCEISSHILNIVMIEPHICWIQEVSGFDFGGQCNDVTASVTAPPTKE